MRRLFIAVFFFFALTVAVIAGAVRGTLLNDDEPLAVSAQAQPKDSLGWAHLKSGQFITSSYQKATMVAFYLDEANSTDDRETKSSSYALITYESAVSRTGQAFVIHEAMPERTYL
jgi:hypothetical protein